MLNFDALIAKQGPGMLNLPILITLSRILLIPVFVASFYWPAGSNHWLAVAIFAIAAFTDWLDGYLARSLSQTTRLGAFLDPVADKLLVVIALVMIVGEMHSYTVILPASIIIAREITVSALREWMAKIGSQMKLRVIQLARVKTATQMLALLLLISYHPGLSPLILHTGILLLAISATLTLVSMTIYLKIAWPDLTLVRDR